MTCYGAARWRRSSSDWLLLCSYGLYPARHVNSNTSCLWRRNLPLPAIKCWCLLYCASAFVVIRICHHFCIWRYYSTACEDLHLLEYTSGVVLWRSLEVSKEQTSWIFVLGYNYCASRTPQWNSLQVLLCRPLPWPWIWRWKFFSS
jgi:hypothetical protein